MKKHPEYLTVRQAQEICQYKWPDSIRRLVYSGTLPATRLKGNRMLIPADKFWEWFHSFDVKPKKPGKLELDGAEPIKKPKGL